MPLFNCSRCGVVENTALGDYWNARRKGKPVLCSECADGVWHGMFGKSFEPIPDAQQTGEA